jgi:hypothetical protein
MLTTGPKQWGQLILVWNLQNYFLYKLIICQVYWHKPVTLSVRRLRQENHEFKASLGYIVRLSPK